MDHDTARGAAMLALSLVIAVAVAAHLTWGGAMPLVLLGAALVAYFWTATRA